MENEAKNIKVILRDDSYIIPRYQRNFAWGKAEISQLIKDIDEFFPKENNEKKSYYLGSLVCFKREDGTFELIDGQQRHTTLTLINLVLKNWENIENWGKDEKKPLTVSNLKYDSRKKVQNYIGSLYQAEKKYFIEKIKELDIPGTGTYKDAIEIIQEELRRIKDVQVFAENFYNNVYLFRVEVPQDTDLNHYFEVMNNRGEQLEKHEIVKALLMGQIKDENEEKKQQDQEKFSAIWNACADMNDYMYFNFEKTDRQNLFDNNGKLKAEDFNSISINKKENNNENKENTNTLAMIIANHKIPNDFPKEEKFIKDKYKSIIDFPNFLLQVLKIKYNDVSLDDKKLLEQFNAIKPDPKEFVFDLLKYRILFDKYVIKQDLTDADESKQNWGIRKLNNDTDIDTTIKTFDDDEELVKLQVMLYYSDSTNTYNNWLQDILTYLGGDKIDLEIYTKKVWNIAKGKFNKDNLSYPEIRIFNLYFIDFLLWKLYAENIKAEENYTDVEADPLNGLKKKIFEQKGLFNSFKFRQLTSREHLLSQEHSIRYKIEESIYNGIGNLCLISTSQNSKGNKENPIDKKKMFQNDNSSLKRLIMFESYENDKWEADQISYHKKEIEILIDNYTKEG